MVPPLDSLFFFGAYHAPAWLVEYTAGKWYLLLTAYFSSGRTTLQRGW